MEKTLTILALLLSFAIFLTACASEPASETTSATTAVTTGVTSTAPEEPLDPVGEAKAELESKGWEDIRVVEGHMDFRPWGGLILEPTDKEKDWSIVNVMGHGGDDRNPITAIIKIAFSDETPMGGRYKVMYVSQGGRAMDTYMVDGKEYVDMNKTLHADDQVLWDYMYSY